MNDYYIDEKLFKEFKDITGRDNNPYKEMREIKEPTPYPTKKPNPALNAMKISNNATIKKEITELDHKFRNLEKAYNKTMKKNSEMMDEIKILKTTNESMQKEINILQITNEKILGEKISMENAIEENKNYVRKLESRLVQGAKNQYLVEINNKLRKEIEDIKSEFQSKANDIEKIKNEGQRKNQEIKILNKALELKVEELKPKGDLKSTLLYDIGSIKQEIDDLRQKNEELKDANHKLRNELDEKLDKIQELNFAKVHLTELLIENENKTHNLDVEKESFEKHCYDLKEERSMLRDYIDKLTEESKEIQDTLITENKNLKDKLRNVENNSAGSDELIKKLNFELDTIKSSNNSCFEKLKNTENTLKLKLNEFFEIEADNKNFKKALNEYEENRNDCEIENEKLNESINKLNKQIQNLEKENFELMKKNKNMLVNQESFQADLVKQNQHLQNVECKLKEQVTKNNMELEKIKVERDNLKKLMNEAINKCSNLFREKSELEKEVNKKNTQIENLKNTNLLLHKNVASNKIDIDTEDEKIMKLGENKLEENSMINLIRREKEKNKEFLEEIKKIKNNINY